MVPPIKRPNGTVHRLGNLTLTVIPGFSINARYPDLTLARRPTGWRTRIRRRLSDTMFRLAQALDPDW